MDSYLVFKTVHLVGVVLFLGNIIVTGWWKVMADRTGEPRIIAFAQRQVTLTDWVFTLGGVALVIVGGAGNAAWHGMAVNTTPWLRTGMLLFTTSGLIWAAILVPLQVKLGRIAKGLATAEAIPAEYWRLERLWLRFGILATLLPLAVIPVMVFKVG